MTWWVYMLRCGDGSLYTGITTDLRRRLVQHRAGAGARYTRGRGPLRLVYREPVSDKPAALRREIAIKRLDAAAKRRLVRDARGRSKTPKKGLQ
jgi:predicted GIY-YIG superfamily endonuclease